MQHDVYEEMYEARDTFWWHKGMRKFFDSFLKLYVRSADNLILDVGCGPGVLFPILRKYGKVYGVDISEEAIKYARRQGVAEDVKLGDAAAIPYESNFFDVVACSDLLYHRNVINDLDVLIEVRRVLKPGGRIIIKEAAYDWLRGRVDELVWTKHRYTKSELRTKLESSHFHIERITHIVTFLFPLALASRILEKVFPRSYNAAEMFESGFLFGGLLASVLYLEAFLVRFFNFPLGLSIIAAARKK